MTFRALPTNPEGVKHTMPPSVVYEEEPGPGVGDERRILLALSKDLITKVALSGLQ